jgi:ATP-dependent DNA ligase
LAFREGSEIELQSKSSQPLSRYFPELIVALGRLKSKMFVLDGEIGIPAESGFSFDALLQRIHPAASRVQRRFNEISRSTGNSLADEDDHSSARSSSPPPTGIHGE